MLKAQTKKYQKQKNNKRKEKIILVTDAMRASGQNVTHSYLGSYEKGIKCIIEDGVAKLEDRSAFAGSVATADRLIRTMVKVAGVPLLEAVNMITVNPIRELNLNVKKGKIESGFDADLIIFDDDINIQKVVLQGEEVNL